MKKVIAIIVIVVVGGIFLIANQATKPGPLDGFAQCLADKEVIFYGAFWCPHCQNQKELFGRSARLLPYVECSTANGQGVLQVCRDAKITGYPTWVFPDESRESGEVSLSVLAERSGCLLPSEFNEDFSTSTPVGTGTTTLPVATSTQP